VPALELHEVDKRFGRVHAVRRASLTFERGRIHAVIGENGAGKSTLLRLAAGLIVPDEGGVRIDGAALAPHTPAEAIRHGVAMVQQHFALVEVLTALENVVLGREPHSRWGALDLRAAKAKAERVAAELGASIAWDVRVAKLGVGERQRVEIARALYRDARVVILDEPTAVLTPGEAKALYATLRRLADAGRAVVVVTHKLDEVRDFADVATVMRRGAILETREVKRSDDGVRALAQVIMSGDSGDAGVSALGGPVRTEPATSVRGEPVLALRDVHVGRAVRGVNLEVRAGEIVGIAGVEGNGQRELVRAIAQLEPIDSGTIRPSAEAIAVVHEDRHQEGLVLDAPILDNVLLGELDRFAPRLLLDRDSMEREARARSSRAQGPSDVSLLVRTLSGGNQQKLVVARAIARVDEGRARVLVVAHPTRGVDLAASRVIHTELLAAASRLVAVVVVSADLHELRALSDRIVVLARGRVSAELPADATDDVIGQAMLAGRDLPAYDEARA
jgi:simple sugar transport system ATP-binding protein